MACGRWVRIAVDVDGPHVTVDGVGGAGPPRGPSHAKKRPMVAVVRSRPTRTTRPRSSVSGHAIIPTCAHRPLTCFLQHGCRSRITRDARCVSTFWPLAHLTLLGEELNFLSWIHA
jgi:hypothetical protein